MGKDQRAVRGNTLLLKINGAIWIVCIIILLVFSLVFYSFEKGQRKERNEQVKVLLGAVFQENRDELANEIFSNHQEALSHTLFGIHEIKGISGVQVFNLDGQLLESVGHSPQKNILLNNSNLQNGFEYKETYVGKKHFVTLNTVIQVVGERVGYCRIWYDLSTEAAASQQRMLLISGIFFFTLLLLSLMLNWLLTRWVIQPVSILHDAMGRVMLGFLGEQLKLRQKDEIGQMATAFNAMSLKLKEQQESLVDSMEMRDSSAQQLEHTNQQLAQLNAELESIVEERTGELRQSYQNLQAEIHERQKTDSEKQTLEERLARSEKMEALGLLAGGVAHDLNNVLSGIVSYPDLIAMQLEEKSPLLPMIHAMRKSGQRAADIVQDMLTLARRGVTNAEVLDLNNEVINDYLQSPELRKLQSIHPDVKIVTRLASDLMNMRGSIVHLKKLIMNLVSNAAEAQQEGGEIIISTKNRYVDQSISSYDQVNEGDYVVLMVEDLGIGIAAEDLGRIFEPFYTNKTMDRSSGTGLGMAVVWGTVQDHNGYINVQSTPNKGTSFELYFPVTREKQLKKDESESIAKFLGNREEILVIDDMAEQRKIATTLLGSLHYSVNTISSGEEAIRYLQNHKADLLLLDMIMVPGIDGLDTYKQILMTHPNQKAVIASGFAENQRVKEAQRLGAGAYIRKPYTIEKIAKAIHKELNRNPSNSNA